MTRFDRTLQSLFGRRRPIDAKAGLKPNAAISRKKEFL
jgi:hypothetical protein